MNRVLHVALQVGLFLYGALAITIVVRVVDALVDLRSAWVAFDDGGSLFSDADVGALWDQWLVLWLVVWAWWLVFFPLLAAVTARAAGSKHSVLKSVLAVVIPGMAAAALTETGDTLAGLFEGPSNDVDRARTLGSWYARGTAGWLAAGFVWFGAMMGAVFLATSEIELAQRVFVLSLLALAIPAMARVALLLRVRSLLRRVDDVRRDGVRAARTESVGA